MKKRLSEKEIKEIKKIFDKAAEKEKEIPENQKKELLKGENNAFNPEQK